MWILLSSKDGIIDKSDTKKEMNDKYGKFEIAGEVMNKFMYVQKKSSDCFLYNSEEQAIADGFDWAFNN